MHSLRFLFCIGVLICVIHQISANSAAKNEAEIRQMMAQMTSNDRRTILGLLFRLRGRVNYRVGEFADRVIGGSKSYIRNGVHTILQGINSAGNSFVNAGNSVINAANDVTNNIINSIDIGDGTPTKDGSASNRQSTSSPGSPTNSESITPASVEDTKKGSGSLDIHDVKLCHDNHCKNLVFTE